MISGSTFQVFEKLVVLVVQVFKFIYTQFETTKKVIRPQILELQKPYCLYIGTIFYLTTPTNASIHDANTFQTPKQLPNKLNHNTP